jgi:hypothetical protein
MINMPNRAALAGVTNPQRPENITNQQHVGGITPQ